MRTIDIGDIDDMALGATLLGTGGGGDPYIGKLMAKAAIERNAEPAFHKFISGISRISNGAGNCGHNAASTRRTKRDDE